MPLPRKTAYAPIALLAALSACGSGETAPPAAPETRAAAAEPASAATPSAAAMTGPAMSKDELAQKVCFLSPEEVEKAMGFKVEAGKPELEMASYGMFACRYDGKMDGLRIGAIWVEPNQVAASRATMTKPSAGEIDQLAGDPDAAYLQYQGEIGGALHYMRRNVMIELRPGRWGKDNAAMKARLLSLRRFD